MSKKRESGDLMQEALCTGSKQKFGMLPSQSLQSTFRIENERIKAEMAMVDGAKSVDDGSVDRKKG